MASMPFAIIGSTQDVALPDGRTVKGREYSWGVAEVENEEHCDFKKLRKLLIRSHMHDLISTTEENHYENYRQSQMGTRKFGEPKFKKYENPKFKEDEDQLRLNFTKQVKDEENRFRQWEAQVQCIFGLNKGHSSNILYQLVSERDRLNKDLEEQHAQIKAMEAELEHMYQLHGRGTIRR